jgi:hypothetical protein
VGRKVGVERQFDFAEEWRWATAHSPMNAAVGAARLAARGVALEDPGDEIGLEAPGSPNIGLWFRDLDG